MITVVEALSAQELTLGCCESLTGGLFASSIVEVPGASKIFKGGLITYATSIKEKLLNIDKQLINEFGVVSKEIACAMAKSSLQLLEVDLSISFTGNAGPDSLENKPAGLVYIALATKDKITVKEYHFKGNRNEVRVQCIEAAKKMILEQLRRK